MLKYYNKEMNIPYPETDMVDNIPLLLVWILVKMIGIIF